MIDLNPYYYVNTISEDLFFNIKNQNTPHRKCFDKNSGIQANKKRPSFSVSFEETLRPLYEKMTGNTLSVCPNMGNFWHYLESEKEIEAVRRWEKEMGTTVFLRDCLFSSVALDHLFVDLDEKKHTAMGEAFNKAKYSKDNGIKAEGRTIIGNAMLHTIKKLPFYKEAKYIAAVPPRTSKVGMDLPTILAARIADVLGLNDVTPFFSYLADKPQGKTLSRDQKWEAMRTSGLTLNYFLGDNDIILIDDLYQSGITINYVGMILQQAGAKRVCGLCAVKSYRDTDNLMP